MPFLLPNQQCQSTEGPDDTSQEGEIRNSDTECHKPLKESVMF